MADKKFTDLTEDTSPSHDDLIATVNDPSGAPASRKVKLSSLWKVIQTWVFAIDSGSNDTYTATLSPAPTAYVNGQQYRFRANTANTGACTINFNGLGAKTIKKASGGITTDLSDNDIRAGQWVDLIYDSANDIMQMQSTLGNAVTTAAPSGSAGGDLTGTYPNPRVAQVNDANGNELLKFGTTASAVNEVTVTNKATGTGPTIEATGGDTNINLNLLSKGSGVVQANGNEVATKKATINAQTGTTYTLQASDNGNIVTCNNASAITVTVPSGLGAGFNCMVIQKGAGQVTFSPSSTTLNNRQSHTKTAGQKAMVTLAADVADNFYLGGDTAS